MSKLSVRPLTLRQANDLVSALHRHHKPVTGHRFSIGAYAGDQFVGAAIVGRPVARKVPAYTVAEVTRLVTDGTPHVCSLLYSACARAAQAMGFTWIQTYILESEPGTSLKAAGWTPITTAGTPCSCGGQCSECRSGTGDWNCRPGRRNDQPTCVKHRWGKWLSKERSER